MIDFSDCQVVNKTYAGVWDKIAIYYNNQLYMLKLEVDNPKGRNRALGENIASSIYKSIGLNAQETILGWYKGGVACACLDFVGLKNKIINFNEIMNPKNQIERYAGEEIEELNNIFKEIDNQTYVDSGVLRSHFCEMFVADALVCGLDRHTSNWGVVISNKGNYVASIFDNGNCLFLGSLDSNLESNLLQKLENHTCRININGNKIKPLEFLKESNDSYFLNALNKILAGIRLDKINSIIDSISDSVLSISHKRICKEVIKYNSKMLYDIGKIKGLSNAR